MPEKTFKIENKKGHVFARHLSEVDAQKFVDDFASRGCFVKAIEEDAVSKSITTY